MWTRERIEAHEKRERAVQMPRLNEATLRERARRDKPALRSREGSAHKLNVHVRTIDRLVRRGKLRGVKVGARMMIDDASIDDLIAAGGE